MAVGGNPPRRCPVQPRFPIEEEVSDDVSITKPLAGNHQSTGRTRAVKVVNHDSRLWEFGLKINFPEFQGGMIPKKILKESPPKFDEYADDEFEICQANVIEDVLVAIQEGETVGKILDCSDEINSPDSTVVKENIWIAYVEKIGKKILTFIFQDSSLQFEFGKINLKYKIDADMIRRIQLHKLEDEFLQAELNDAGRYSN
ncbi:hypothetical protein RHGRI_030025 [Rhododendron griersonianum]|uniref:Uncharacterized protein n=1 Tax=Rhododendron griersonianum TaxID=479676 RepID=A0AAV6ILG4_9ERIC|nr:hypothetical protein RHGRI_030025 [Rhododendron griersonianum]